MRDKYICINLVIASQIIKTRPVRRRSTFVEVTNLSHENELDRIRDISVLYTLLTFR